MICPLFSTEPTKLSQESGAVMTRGTFSEKGTAGRLSTQRL